MKIEGRFLTFKVKCTRRRAQDFFFGGGAENLISRER